LAFLEKVTLAPGQLGMEDVANVRRAGVSDRAILDATYICVGFNIITRIADALGFKIPAEELLVRAAKLLRIFGYRRLSGFWIYGSSKNPSLHDPYAKKMERLRHAVLSGPGSLPSHVRQAISAGASVSGALEVFVQKLTAEASTLTDDDVAELHRAGYTDDQIFEAIVSAAVGAGLFRLETVLNLLRSNPTNLTPFIAPALSATIDRLRPETIST
jgi:alkylhydroperoxidase/carboxymuconolactone decarboxylase family protein YurZ